ncbi:MAG TPA: DUF4249 domain-containing protein, partial [Adhaeribacter sp.]|nr:DUF4249 domain-containing protein [Adhaeribacter sp.]
LKEIRPGEFHTSATGIRGRVGGIYSLKVRLKDGQEFVSEPEKLNPVPPIDRLYYQLKEISYIDENNNEQRTPYFELQVDVQDPPGERNYYKWVSEGTYEVETQPEDFQMQDRLGNDIPSPKSCCRQCWIGRKDLSVKVVSDKQFDGNKMVGKAVGTIPVTPRYMGIKYHVNLQQHSLSQNAFEFWSMLEKQAVGTGSLQDAAPANAWGNMYNVQKPDERVLGYFGASAIARKEGWFQRSDVPFFLPRFVYPDDCRAIPGATTTRPPFWQ